MTLFHTAPGGIDIGVYEDEAGMGTGVGEGGASVTTSGATTPPTPEIGGAVDIGTFEEPPATDMDAIAAAPMDLYHHFIGQGDAGAVTVTDGGVIDHGVVTIDQGVDIGTFDAGLLDMVA